MALLSGFGWYGVLNAASASASEGGRGPSAAADGPGNVYVYWMNSSDQLAEAFWNTYTNTWSSQVLSFAGTIGSQPGVVVSARTSVGPGGKAFGNQYVFWQGSGHGAIWYAWWGAGSPGATGVWHGPYKTSASGTDGYGVPAALMTNCLTCGYDPIHLFYRGSNGDLMDVTTNNAQNPSGWGSTTDLGDGPMGSSPIVPAGQCLDCGKAGGGVEGEILWQGQDTGLWEETYLCNQVTSGCIIPNNGRVKWTGAGNMGSPPTAVGESATNEIFWRGQDANLYECFAPDPGSPVSIACNFFGIPTVGGNIGSGPSAAWTPARPNDMYLFWKGTGGELWEAFRNGCCSNSFWTLIHLPQMGYIGATSP